MADNKVSVELTVEVAEALKSLSQVTASVKKFADDAEKNSARAESGLGRIGSAIKNIAIGGLSIQGIKDIYQTVSDIASIPLKGALKAEELRAVDTQFRLIAGSAGLLGDELKAGLEKAADGLVGTDDLLQAASRSVVALGGNAKELPKLFEVARKAASVFGGDLIQRFEEISFAVESGNVRGLKNLGIIIDQDKAYKDYAKSIGVSTDKLVTSEKQQAILNAVLEKSKSAFAGVDVNVRELQNNTLRFNTAIKDLGEASATAFDKLFGKTIKGGAGEVVQVVQELTRAIRRAGGETIPTSEKISVLGDDLVRLKKLSDDYNKSTGTNAGNIYDSQIKSLEKQLQLLERRNNIASGGSGETSLNLDPNAAKAAIRANQASAASAGQVGPNPDQVARNKATAEQEQLLQDQITAIQAQGAVSRGEATVLLQEAESGRNIQTLDALQSLEDTKLALTFNAEQKKNALIEDSAKRQEATKLTSAKRIAAQEELDGKQSVARKMFLLEQEKQITASRLQAAQNFLQAGANLAKEGSATQKALQIGVATVSTYSAATQALAAAPGPPFTIPLAASIVALGLSNIAKISGVQFAQGGIVPGSNFVSDKVSASLNSGEMVLNKQQQAQLFDIANGSGGGNNGGVVAAIELLGNKIAAIQQQIIIDGREIARVVRDQREAGFAV